MRRDALTVVSLTIVAYAFSNVIHEILGHGGACLLIRARVVELSALHCACSTASRFMAAAGCIANVIAAAIGMLVFRRRKTYFWWLFTTINLLMPAGYLLFFGVLDVGDW